MDNEIFLTEEFISKWLDEVENRANKKFTNIDKKIIDHDKKFEEAFRILKERRKFYNEGQ